MIAAWDRMVSVEEKEKDKEYSGFRGTMYRTWLLFVRAEADEELSSMMLTA